MTTLENTFIKVETVAEIQDAVRGHSRIGVRGGGSKPVLSTPIDQTTLLDLSALRGVTVYDPGEFTFTAKAATPLTEVEAMLAEKGQYLPFDPPLAEDGATLGGTVAAGLSGPGRFRYGGVRDFLIGIRFVDGRGEEVRGGGNVVKNAAGFDFPKLMVGSLGKLGILTELTFKVFPAPPATGTLRAVYADLNPALDALNRLAKSKFDIDALDLAPLADGIVLWVRLGGLPNALPDRLERLAALLSAADAPQHMERHGADNPAPHWPEMKRMSWCGDDATLVKIPVTPARIRTFDAELARQGAIRRYSAGGNTAWVAWKAPIDGLESLLQRRQLAGLCLLGMAQRPWIGHLPGRALVQRVASTLDPMNKFAVLDAYPVKANVNEGD
ncbi:FAD-binding protein [bacterium]|nr:FAD-binding protein [bacterium]